MRQPAIAEQRRRRTPHEIQKRNVDLWHGKEPSGYCTAGDSSLMMPWASGEGLVTSPKRAATFTRSNWSSGERERCAIIVDRHVHKNGGSTMRDIFLENERLGYGLYQGYTQLLWRQDFAVLQRIAERAVAEKRSPNHFIMMEAPLLPSPQPRRGKTAPPHTRASPPATDAPLQAHFGFEEFANRPLSDLVRLKQLYQAAGVRCPIALMTRVRCAAPRRAPRPAESDTAHLSASSPPRPPLRRLAASQRAAGVLPLLLQVGRGLPHTGGADQGGSAAAVGSQLLGVGEAGAAAPHAEGRTALRTTLPPAPLSRPHQVPNLQSSIMVRGMTAMGAEYSGRIHASRRTIGPAGGCGRLTGAAARGRRTRPRHARGGGP